MGRVHIGWYRCPQERLDGPPLCLLGRMWSWPTRCSVHRMVHFWSLWAFPLTVSLSRPSHYWIGCSQPRLLPVWPVVWRFRFGLLKNLSSSCCTLRSRLPDPLHGRYDEEQFVTLFVHVSVLVLCPGRLAACYTWSWDAPTSLLEATPYLGQEFIATGFTINAWDDGRLQNNDIDYGGNFWLIVPGCLTWGISSTSSPGTIAPALGRTVNRFSNDMCGVWTSKFIRGG